MLPPLLLRTAGVLLLAVAPVVACGFQTGGLPSAGSAGTTTTPAPGTGGGPSSSTGGHGGHGGTTAGTSSTGGHGTGGAGHTGGGTTGTADAGPDAAEAGPVEAGPTTFASCKDLLAAQPKDASGVYELVDSAQHLYWAFCEMKADDGGWTLALKIDGNKTTFPYDSPLWTSTDPLTPAASDLDQTEAKLASFWSTPFTQVRVGMIDGNQTRWLVVGLSGTSLLDVIKSGGSTSAGRGAWEGLLASGSLQTNCNWEGLNQQTRVRLGIVGDESGNCGSSPSPDSFIGFGAASYFGGPSGNTAHFSPDHGDRDTRTFGYVMVR